MPETPGWQDRFSGGMPAPYAAPASADQAAFGPGVKHTRTQLFLHVPAINKAILNSGLQRTSCSE